VQVSLESIVYLVWWAK